MTIATLPVLSPEAFQQHLEAQLRSVERLLAALERQHGAILSREVPEIVQSAIEVQSEMARRLRLEMERAELLERVGEQLGRPAEQLLLDDLLQGVPAAQADRLRVLSARLRHGVHQLQLRHQHNRELIRQELGYVDYMLETLGNAPVIPGYTASGSRTSTAPAPVSVVDVKG